MAMFSSDPEIDLSVHGRGRSSWVKTYKSIDFPTITRLDYIPGSCFRKLVWGGGIGAIADSRAVILKVDLGVQGNSGAQDKICLPPNATSLRAVAGLLEKIAKDVEEHADLIRKDNPRWYREHQKILARGID